MTTVRLVDPLEDRTETSALRSEVARPQRKLRLRRISIIVAIPLLALILLAVVAGRTTQFFSNLDPRKVGPRLTHTVESGELLISVTENGTLESASNEEIKCEVAGGSTILWIIEDGTDVKKGDELVRLDASKIEEDISAQQIKYEQARSTQIQAESDLAVAEISVQEYVEGTYPAELQLAQSNVAIAQENLRVAQNMLEHGTRMHRKGYVSALEKDAHEFSVEHALLELAMKHTEEDVLKRFTRAKTLQDLESKLKAAKAKMLSDKAALDLEEARLTRLKAQRERCVILAPADGMVIYPQTERWRQEPAIKEGAQVRERQTLIQLPDLTKLQVKVKVHESKVKLLKPRMRARILIQGETSQGEVVSVANRAEQSGWWSGSNKEFSVIVKIDSQTNLNLKPGMSAEVEMLVDRHADVLSLPVAAIVEQQDQFYCWVKAGKTQQRRSLVLGASNDQFIVVKDGVLAGEKVILNPRAIVEEARLGALELPQEKPAEETFGAATAVANDTRAKDDSAGDPG